VYEIRPKTPQPTLQIQFFISRYEPFIFRELSLIRPPATFSQRKLGEGRDEGGDPEVFL
jgi:hypothetical protein